MRRDAPGKDAVVPVGVARRAAVALLVGASALTAIGCRSVTPAVEVDVAALAGAVEALGRPLPGDLSALYHLRVPASGALRLAVLQHDDAGRMTVSEPFGSAVSVSSWEGTRASAFFDLRRGCRLEATDVSAVLGVAAMPMPQAVRLLGGRLPAMVGDRVIARDDGRLEVAGDGWRAVVTVAPEPWRVTEVVEWPDAREGWRVRLGDHSGSVPGSVRVDGRDAGWAELELVRLQWDTVPALPPEPDVPPCESLNVER